MTIRDLGWNEIQRKLRDLESKKIDVGLQSDVDSDIVNHAFWNEFGTRDIPERSFLRSTLTENTNELKNKAQDLVNNLENTDVNQGLGLIGLFLETQVKKKILNGTFTANSPDTIKKKGSSKPLIDTAQMLNSIRFEIT